MTGAVPGWMPGTRRWRGIRRWVSWTGRGVVALPVLATAACAGATLGSGVGEARFERAPYYAGGGGVEGGSAVGWAPVTWQPGATQEDLFDPATDEGSPVARLLTALNAELEAIGRGDPSRWAGPLDVPRQGAPDVQFGCETAGWDECVMTEAEDGFGPGRPRMRLAVTRPTDGWMQGASEGMAGAQAASMVVLTLEIGQYWPRQTDWRGSKAVELGTDRIVSLPWLTALDAPVAVLQLTGALVGSDGKPIRIGAEGLLARRTPIVASGFGAQALITDAEVEELLGEGHGVPVWRDALVALLGELTGREVP